MWPENPKKHSLDIIVLALTLRINYFSCNQIYPKSPQLKHSASRKHLSASVEKRENLETIFSLDARPWLHTPYIGSLFSTSTSKTFYSLPLISTLITQEKSNCTRKIFLESCQNNYFSKILFILFSRYLHENGKKGKIYFAFWKTTSLKLPK